MWNIIESEGRNRGKSINFCEKFPKESFHQQYGWKGFAIIIEQGRGKSICGYRVLRIESYDFPGSGDCFRSYRPSVTLTESRKSAQSIFDRRQTAIVAGYVHFSPPRKCPLTSFDHAFPGEHRASTSRHDSLRGEILLLRQFLISQDWFSPLVVNSERCRLCLFNFILE